MSLQTIDAGCLAKMFLAGAKRLESKKEWINELNVFPVPDGDTGTNMTLTIMSAAKDVAAMAEPDMPALSKAISSGSLRGARGNSGVILSQLFRGFTKGIRDYDVITIPVMAAASEKAVETAYKAVMKPKEGTILTVAKGASMKARELADAGEEDMEKFLKEIIDHAEYVLSQTPEMLPVLKQAGVVDSGGQGLVEVLRGAFDAFTGKVSADSYDFSEPAKPAASEISAKGSLEAQAGMEIKFGYCTEFIIMLNKTFNIKQEMDFKAYLESIGDSIVVVADDDVVKVHVHTNDPGLAIQKALKYGALSNMKIDNMRLEHQEKLFKLSEKEKQAQEAAAEPEAAGEHKEAGFVAVSAGDGLAEIFRGLGVDYVIEGGQTMNPSTEDVVNAIGKVNADTVYVLPNNKNIILAASQAKYLVEDKNVVVVPTKTIPQGITAVINFVPDMGAEENEASMTEEISHVRTGEVTYAVRDTVIDDRQIRQGDYMGIGDDGILAVGSDIADVAYDMTAAMMDDDCELISIYYGADVTQEDAENLKARVEERYPSCDIELQYGGQPIYYYIISAE